MYGEWIKEEYIVKSHIMSKITGFLPFLSVEPLRTWTWIHRNQLTKSRSWGGWGGRKGRARKKPKAYKTRMVCFFFITFSWKVEWGRVTLHPEANISKWVSKWVKERLSNRDSSHLKIVYWYHMHIHSTQFTVSRFCLRRTSIFSHRNSFMLFLSLC